MTPPRVSGQSPVGTTATTMTTTTTTTTTSNSALAGIRKIDLNRVERLQEEERRRSEAAAQKQRRHEHRMQTSALYRLVNRIGDRMVLKNRMGREVFKMGLVLAIPVVGTLLLMQPQFSEYIVLNYTPYLEREEAHEDAFRLSKIMSSGKRDYRRTDSHFFDLEEDKEWRVKRHLEYLKQQQQQQREQEKAAAAAAQESQKHEYSDLDDDIDETTLTDRFWYVVDAVFDKLLPLRGMATDELLRLGAPTPANAPAADCTECERNKAEAQLRSQLAERSDHESKGGSRFRRVISQGVVAGSAGSDSGSSSEM